MRALTKNKKKENGKTATATSGAMAARAAANGVTAAVGSRIGNRSFKRAARLQSVRAHWPGGDPVHIVMQS